MTEEHTFSQLNLIAPLLEAVAREGYTEPTPIQQMAIPHLLEGRDLLGCAQTGTGKTAAFALPILQRLVESGGRKGRIRVLVLTPTRELAAQIEESFRTYGRNLDLLTTVVFGGVSQLQQEQAIKRRPDILVATPGRLLDLMNQRIISLADLDVFVLDEADRMLDMGFIHDVRRVIAVLPARRQSLFFSATMPPAVAKLADGLLSDPIRVEVVPQATPAERIAQSVMFVDKGDKRALLEHLLRDRSLTRALVFTRTKHLAGRVAKQLSGRGIAADAIHGNKSQSARTRALSGFRTGDLRVLVATDIAARGIDVDDVSHVINYDLPNEPESYVHRIGRTARAGAEGISVSFCGTDEVEYLLDIEKLLGNEIPVDADQPFHDARVATAALEAKARKSRSQPRQRPARPAEQQARQRPERPAAQQRQEGAAKRPRRRRRRPRTEGGADGRTR